MILLFLTFRFTSWPVPVPIRPVCQFMDTTGGLLNCPPAPCLPGEMLRMRYYPCTSFILHGSLLPDSSFRPAKDLQWLRRRTLRQHGLWNQSIHWWKQRQIHTPKLQALLERKTAFSQDLPLSTGHSDPFLFLGLFITVHADTPADQQAFSLYHIALPDSASIVSYNKEKL